MHAVVFANGEIADLDAVRRYVDGADLVICADGGSRHTLALGVHPHAVVGDLDSLAAALRADLVRAGTEFIPFSASKDETDLELSLLYAVEQGATEITVCGARGGRVDHELANFLLLVHPGLEGVDVRVVSGNQEVRMVRGEVTFAGSTGDLLSLLPIGGDAYGVTTQGLAYPLDDEVLCFGPARGVSNVFTTSAPTVRLRAGLLLAVHTRRPDAGWQEE